MAAAWGRLKGHADEHIRDNVLATRAVSEENRRLMRNEPYDTLIYTPHSPVCWPLGLRHWLRSER
eukprot:8401067-Pyramimonas_sp.AAC.1